MNEFSTGKNLSESCLSIVFLKKTEKFLWHYELNVNRFKSKLIIIYFNRKKVTSPTWPIFLKNNVLCQWYECD